LAYRLPNEVKKLAEKVTEFHGVIRQGLTNENQPHLKATTYLKIISSCLGLKDGEFFDKLLMVCEADAKGRLGFENQEYLQRKFWKNMALAAQKVDNQQVMATGVKGAAIGVAIEKERLKYIKRYLKGISL
jgi:tRNA nucleotidyltransferase (CCA-adding enzyme)